MQEHLGLLVLVLQDGVVKQRLVAVPDGTSQKTSPPLEPAQRVAAGAEPAGGTGALTAETLNGTERFVVGSLLG